MQTKMINESIDFEASPKEIYDIIIDSEKHAELIGADAEIIAEEGSEFSMWDGSISGTVKELVPNELIVLNWRSDEDGWPKDHYSVATFELIENEKGRTTINFVQENIPEGNAHSVSEGWHDFYWQSIHRMLGDQ